jgi:hypothetical protein
VTTGTNTKEDFEKCNVKNIFGSFGEIEKFL